MCVQRSIRAGIGVVALISLLACGKSQTPQPTARDALVVAMKAAHDGNADALEAACRATDDQRKLLDIEADYTRACVAFHDAFVAAYGAAAWATFQDPNHKLPDAEIQLDYVDTDRLKLCDSIPIREQGNEAWVDGLEKGWQLHLIKTGDGWLVDAACFVPPAADPKQMAPMMQSMTELVRKYQKAIGRAGIGPDDVQIELARAVGEVIFGIKPKGPHKFDIDKM